MSRTSTVTGLALLLVAASALPGVAIAAAVVHDVAKVNGFQSDRFTWTDSAGLKRSVSIKQEGHGNAGHGGYAIQATYQYQAKGKTQTVTVNPTDKNEGFGYFVSHELYRTFTDGDYDTIANKVFGVDDSPLGRGIAATTQVLTPGSASQGGIRVTTTYHHYGTVDPIVKNKNGEDAKPTPTDPAKLANYPLPVTITWSFQDGTDYPRISTVVDLSGVGPDRIDFDVRGPYGVMDFKPAAAVIDTAMWGDRYHFINTDAPIQHTSAWTWNDPNSGARYSALISGKWEMGLFEPKPFAKSALADGYSDARGNTSATYNNGNGCPDANQLLPCDYEWPYQSVQYSLPTTPTGATNYPKMAWGSSPYYGTGTSLKVVYDTSETSEKFNGHPSKIAYDICLVLGRTKGIGLTRLAARKPATYNCAAAVD